MNSIPHRVPEIAGVAVVLVGSVDYSALHPEWFRANGLLSEEEARSAKVEIVHPEATSFAVPDAFAVRGEGGRILCESSAPQWFETVRDLTIGVLKLATESVTALGINRIAHWDVVENKARDAIGQRLVPQENWPELASPKLESVVMQGARTDDFKGHISVRVEPSVQIRHGVFVATNDHFAVDSVETGMRILEEGWTDAMVRADALMHAALGEMTE